MSDEGKRRQSSNPTALAASIPKPPPLPAPRSLQRARDAAYKFIGYPSRPSSPHVGAGRDSLAQAVIGKARHASLTTTQNATASHKTGLEINTIAINERGTHALLGGKEIFKTVKIENGICAEEVNLRTAIRSKANAASGKPRQTYSIDIADVAWAKGDCGDYVAAATSSGKIILYDLGHAGFPAAQLHEHFRQVHKVTFNPHRGNLLLSGSQDGTVRLWDLRDVRHEANSLQSKRKFSGQSDGVRDVKWSPTDGVDFAFGTDSGWIQRWDMRYLKAAKVKVPAHTLSCNIIDWHPDGRHIDSASSDQFVRVWDFSHNNKQKALWEIKAPHPVLNARWRPSCESSMAHDNGARQCTQLVTAYDREHPVLHVWDLRRPALPFREMSPYTSAPTDLLWHSQDLLWTVGREGTFLQSDIQHAPKVIDKRSLSSFAISPEGDVKFVAQKRKQHRLLKLHHHSTKGSRNGDSLSISPETTFLSRSWADDTLDHSFLSVAVASTKRQSRSESIATIDVNNSGELTAVLPLGMIMNNRRSFTPQQSMVIGKLPYSVDPDVFRHLAAKYVYAVELAPAIGQTFLQVVDHAFDSNAQLIASTGLHSRAKSVKIAAFITLDHLQMRANAQCDTAKSKSKHPGRATGSPVLRELAMRLLDEHHGSPEPFLPSARPISTLTTQLAAMESTSNVPTPLARPVTDAKMSTLQDSVQLSNLDIDGQLTLPPSISPVQQSSSDRSFFDSQLTAQNLQSLSGTDRVEMVRRWSVQPRIPLNLDPVEDRNSQAPPKLQTHDSDQSFAFLVGSADSKVPFSSFGSGGPAPHHNLPTVSMATASASSGPVKGDTNGHKVPPSENMEERPAARGRGRTNARSGPLEEPLHSLPDDHSQDLEEGKPFILVELLIELMKDAVTTGDAQTATMLVTMMAPLLPRTHSLSQQEVEDTVLSYTDTYAAMGLLPDEIATIFDQHFQHTVTAGLQPLQIESILSCYHAQLLSFRMFAEAAYLRKLAYPAYPAVYEDYHKDNVAHFKCGGCGKPMQSGMAQLKCETCHEKQASCPVCWLSDSPYHGGKLMSSCLLCGHGGHAGCLQQWFEDGNGEECPTGCGCLCSGRK